MADITGILSSRFGRGRVAQLAVRQALASSSRRAEGSGDGGGAAAADDDDDRNYLCVAPSSASVTSHTPVTVPLEVEYSQASQGSQRFHDEGEEACPTETAWEEASLPEIPEEQGSCGSPTALSTASPPASLSSPLGLGSEVGGSGGHREGVPEQFSQRAGGHNADGEEEALLLCSMLNGCGGQRQLRQLGSPPSPPALSRLRYELRQELSASVVFSPLVAVVSEHSFEDAACLQAFGRDGGGEQDAAPSPEVALDSGTDAAAAAVAAALCTGQQGGGLVVSEEEPPAKGKPAPAKWPCTSKRPGRLPLRRSATPIAAALGDGLGGGGSGTPRDKEHSLAGHAVQAPELQEAKLPGKEGRRLSQPCVVKQQVWSFDSIPQGRATIPSGHSQQLDHLPPELPGPGVKKLARPRTVGVLPSGVVCHMASSDQQPLPAAPASKPEGDSAARSLGLPRRSSCGRAQGSALEEAAGPALRVRVVDDGAVAEAGPVPGEEGGICAEDALQTVRALSQPAQLGTALWVSKQEPTLADSDTPCTKYSHERFLAHLDKLSLAMATRLQKRQHAQADLCDKITSFQESVRAQRLGGQGSSGSGNEQQQEHLAQQQAVSVLEPEEYGPILGWVHHASEAGRRAGRTGDSISNPRLKALLAQRQLGSLDAAWPSGSERGACPARLPAVLAVASAASGPAPAEKPWLQETSPVDGLGPAAAGITSVMPAASSSHAAVAASPAMETMAECSPCPASPPEAAAGSTKGQLRASGGGTAAVAEEGSAGLRLDRVKPIMQVKLEQDIALKYLTDRQRAFRANPLPLSTMEPRMAGMEQRTQQHREEMHAKRLEQLRSQERPFSFYPRDQEKQRVALAAAAEGLETSSRPRPAASRPFSAHPVPVSTTEARYALLLAEMQLQNRTVLVRSLNPPSASTAAPLLPATAQTTRQQRDMQLLPERAATSLELRVAGDALASGDLSSSRSTSPTSGRRSGKSGDTAVLEGSGPSSDE